MAKTLQSENKRFNIIGILIGIIIVLGVALIYTNFQKTQTMENKKENIVEEKNVDIEKEKNNNEEYFIGQQLNLTGNLIESGNLISYTNLFISNDGKTFGAKSSVIDLNNITGTIKISGIIDDIKNNLYIINITSITELNNNENSNKNNTKNETTNNKKEDIKYIKEAGLFIHSISGTNISMSFDPLNQKIILEQIDKDNGKSKSLEISYFKCDNSSNDTNCKYLKKTFSEISSIDFTTDDGDQFYSLVDLNGRFGTIDNNFGYYLQTDDKIFLINMMQHVQFLSKTYIQNYLSNTATKLCNSGNIQLNSIINMDINIENNIFIAKIKGQDISNNKLICNIDIDPTLELGGVLKNIKIIKDNLTGSIENNNIEETGQNLNNNTNIEEEIPENTQNNETNDETTYLQKDPNIEQFKINIDNPYKFTARQGYTLLFPSKNIWFDSTNIKKDLGVEGLYCYVQINIIKYTSNIEENKKLVEQSPDVTIYVCNKNENIIDNLKKEYFVKFIPNEDKKMFVIKPINKSWFDFAKNITIE